MSRFADLLKLNFMWIICSLPIVTIGAATIAAFTVSLKMAENKEGHIGRNFLKAFKTNLKQGIVMTFITVFLLWSVFLNFEHSRVYDSVWFLIIFIMSAYFVTFLLLYVYPLLARYENTVFKSLRNSLRISMRYFVRSIALLLILAVEAALIMWNFTTIFIGVLIGPAFMIYTVSGVAMAIFKLIDRNSEYEDE
jgi:uncharacterized membrane protein YesL